MPALVQVPWWLRWERICLQCRRLGFDPWVGKIPWRRAWQPTPVFLHGEFHGQRSLPGYSPWGHKVSNTTEWLTLLLWLRVIAFCSWQFLSSSLPPLASQLFYLLCNQFPVLNSLSWKYSNGLWRGLIWIETWTDLRLLVWDINLGFDCIRKKERGPGNHW